MEDERAMRKMLDFTRALSVLFLVIHIYYYCYQFFQGHGLSAAWSDSLLTRFSTKTGLFAGPWVTKLIVAVFLLLSCMGTRGKPSDTLTWKPIWVYLGVGGLFFFGSGVLLDLPYGLQVVTTAYVAALFIGYLLLLRAGNFISRILRVNLMGDVFNTENETFPQEERLMPNEWSVNLPTEYQLGKKYRKGWINIVNPFRGAMVLGTPGSGKTYAIVNEYIRQHSAKGFAMYIYDYKFPDLSTIAYNELLKHQDKFHGKKPVQFCVINFDNPRQSQRCNPLLPELMTDIIDAWESAQTILLNLNKTWIRKQGDFFVESPINLLTAIIWFLRRYENGKFCTFPHVIEFLGREYEEMFPILGSYPEIENYIRPFAQAYENEAMEQVEGQIASARIPLSRLSSPQLYWVMSGNEFSLDINNPDEPKVLCVGNNPDRAAIYGAALGLYNARLVKLVNKKRKLKCSIIIDELPTIYFKGLDNLIATARSNKVSTCLGLQDKSQLDRDYGKEESTVIMNTIGNIFSGSVLAETAKLISERAGRNLQKRQSMSINDRGSSTSTSTQLDSMIPPAKISQLTQGTFVGAVADNMGEEITQKIFHAKIKIDVKRVAEEERAYKPIPEATTYIDARTGEIRSFYDEETGEDLTDQILLDNYNSIKQDIDDIVGSEIERIKASDKLRRLIKPKKVKKSA